MSNPKENEEGIQMGTSQRKRVSGHMSVCVHTGHYKCTLRICEWGYS